MFDPSLYEKELNIVTIDTFESTWNESKNSLSQMNGFFDRSDIHSSNIKKPHILFQFQYYFQSSTFHKDKTFLHTVDMLSNQRFMISHIVIDYDETLKIKKCVLLSCRMYDPSVTKSHVTKDQEIQTNCFNLWHDTLTCKMFRIIAFHSSFRCSTRKTRHFLMVYENNAQKSINTCFNWIQHTMNQFFSKQLPKYVILNCSKQNSKK